MTCAYCGKELEGNRKYCNLSCCAKDRNTGKANFDKRREMQRNEKVKLQEEYLQNLVYCKACGIDLPFEKRLQDYCSKSCSNKKRIRSAETNQKISESLKGRIYSPNSRLLKKLQPQSAKASIQNVNAREWLLAKGYIEVDSLPICKFCNLELNSFIGLKRHLNSHVDIYVVKSGKPDAKVVMGEDELDITNKFLAEYRDKILFCEICGKPAGSEIVTVNGKKSKKRLSADHCHKTKKFRGLLCTYCNLSLGWYENLGDKMYDYLNRPSVGDVELAGAIE